ncbi:MAG: NAD(P)-dependent oxidoreductase [Cytophagales bacterium]|nr:NAD(P)-dependent oxidoreductase [Cytophagales bacterium]
MKIVILGAHSFLAQAVIRQLNADPSHELVLYGSYTREDDHRKYYRIPETSLEISTLSGFDAIVYCAGAGVQSNKKYPKNIIYEVNAFEPIRIINLLNETGYSGKFISFGSYFEIGDYPYERPLAEEEVLLSAYPVPNDYCLSKRVFSRYIQNQTDFSFDSLHFILPNIYGYGENENRLIPYLVRSITNGEKLALSSGVQIRQYLHVDDIARAVTTGLGNEIKGVFNLGSHEIISIKQLVAEVVKVSGEQVEAEFGAVNQRDQGMKYLALNFERAADTLKFHPEISLEEGIKGYFVKVN